MNFKMIMENIEKKIFIRHVSWSYLNAGGTVGIRISGPFSYPQFEMKVLSGAFFPAENLLTLLNSTLPEGWVEYLENSFHNEFFRYEMNWRILSTYHKYILKYILYKQDKHFYWDTKLASIELTSRGKLETIKMGMCYLAPLLAAIFRDVPQNTDKIIERVWDPTNREYNSYKTPAGLAEAIQANKVYESFL